MKIALIACCKKKQGQNEPDKKFKAKNLYLGNSFKKSINQGVEKFGCDDYYIISAKHHLLDKGELVSYYDKTLSKMSVKERHEWADEVLKELGAKFDLSNDEFFIFGGTKYYENLAPHLNCTVFNYQGSNSINLDSIKAVYRNGGK